MAMQVIALSRSRLVKHNYGHSFGVKRKLGTKNLVIKLKLKNILAPTYLQSTLKFSMGDICDLWNYTDYRFSPQVEVKGVSSLGTRNNYWTKENHILHLVYQISYQDYGG